MVTSEPSCIEDANNLIWGSGAVTDDVFQRWCQGFTFSPFETSALQQNDGGPCAIITAVQAAIISDMFFNRSMGLAEVNEADCIDLLSTALVDILALVSRRGTFRLVYLDVEEEDTSQQASSNPSTTDDGPIPRPSPNPVEAVGSTTSSSSTPVKTMDHRAFSEKLRCLDVEGLEDLRGCVLSLCPGWQAHFGVLCFLYSALLSHGLADLRESMAEEADTLIDPVHGHASQCLLNLLITGCGTPHLFDGDRDLAGFVMMGISKQPKTGFLTIVEAMRYCEVGWYLKNPAYPVWVMGSETHLTLLFSPELTLIQREGGLRRAQKCFHELDPAENGFLQHDKLVDLLTACELSTEPAFMARVKERVDPEDLGIILENSFLREFYEDEMKAQATPLKNFQLYHYNPLARSNSDGKVRYRPGKASICDVVDLTTDEDAAYLRDNSPMQRCLLTKWPTIQVEWERGIVPSLN